MAEHLRGHGIERLLLRRHLHRGGPRKDSQLLTWNPVKASFSCRLCPGQVFATGEITAETVTTVQQFDPGVRAHLVGLTDPVDRDEMTRRYLDGSLNRERLRQLRGADARRRSAAGARPAVEHRRRRLQQWMLERMRVHGVFERVLEEADRLDAAGWAALAVQRLSRETLRDYWQDIPVEERERARAAGRKHAEKST